LSIALTTYMLFAVGLKIKSGYFYSNSRQMCPLTKRIQLLDRIIEVLDKTANMGTVR